jgi:hypothetical protein
MTYYGLAFTKLITIFVTRMKAYLEDESIYNIALFPGMCRVDV